MCEIVRRSDHLGQITATFTGQIKLRNENGRRGHAHYRNFVKFGGGQQGCLEAFQT